MSIRKLAFPALAAAMALAVTACDRGDEGTYGQSDEATMQEDTTVAQDQGTANDPANQPGTAGSTTATTPPTDNTYGEEPLPDAEEPYAHADSGEQHGRPVARTGDADESTGRITEGDDTTGGVTPGMESESLADLPDFDEIDTNSDGRISRDEAGSVTGLEEHFERIDANSDDHLSNDEYDEAKDEA